jgi:hypothetical protein
MLTLDHIGSRLRFKLTPVQANLVTQVATVKLQWVWHLLYGLIIPLQKIQI